MIDELFTLDTRRESLLELCLGRRRELINIHILQRLCAIYGDPGMLLDLVDCDAVLRLLFEQLDDQIVQGCVEHLFWVLRLGCLDQPVQFGVLRAHKWVVPCGHIEECDATGPYVVQSALIHRSNAGFGRVEVV